MSLGIYPVFETELADAKFDSLGESLAANFETLDAIALSAELMPITAFADNRPIPDDFEGDPDELREVMGVWTEWFNPSLGRTAIQALSDHLNINPDSTQFLHDTALVQLELLELARALSIAESKRVRFRLEMS